MIRTLSAMLVVMSAISPLCAQTKPSSAGQHRAQPRTKAAPTRVYGAGPSMIYPLLSAWSDEYKRLHADAEISYQAVGSGGGILLLTDKKVFFALAKAAMTDDQLARVSGRILQFPVALDAVVPIYNLAEVPHLRLSGSTLADIFLGKITKWDDPAIVSDNPGVDLPRMDIKVAHYFPNGGQFDTFYIANYLSKISPAFKATLADSSSTDWPTRSASAAYTKGAGVTGFIAETPGAIGYIWWDTARHSSLTYAAIKNSEDEFVVASPESLTAAGATAVPAIQAQLADSRALITNAPGKGSYPIAYFVWFLMYADSAEGKQHEVMADFLKWVLTDGQTLASKLGYPPLPHNLAEIELQHVETPEKQ